MAAFIDSSSRQTALCEALRGRSYQRRKVSFLLGTDEAIQHEARVALTPSHLGRLRSDLVACGLEPSLHVISGAGVRARNPSFGGFSDRDYEERGARVVSSDEAALLPQIDVLHALKEPTEYESHLPGPMLRFGALHLASKPSGVCQMLSTANFAAILDGGTVGYCSFLKDQSDRTPVVASMSRFAGAVAGRKLVEGLDRNNLGIGKIVVVGGGIAGCSAIAKIVDRAAPLVVVELYAPTRKRLPSILRSLGAGNFEIVEAVTDEVIEGAVGIIFAHRSGAQAAEKVCRFEQIRRMAQGAAIADIAIDQGGSILHSGYEEKDSAVDSREKYRELLSDYAYYAETNMPREEPKDASETHGDASLPYVTMLLALCAEHGGPEGATSFMLEREIRHFSAAGEVDQLSFVDCLVQDLRNGLQLAAHRSELEITDPDIVGDEGLSTWVRACGRSSSGNCVDG